MAIVRDPIYQQLNSELRQLLPDFAAGDKFLSEREVSERFGVSRATANKALSNLVVEGVLSLRKGVGTFVSGEILDYDLRSLVSFTHKARAAGKTPGTHVLTLETVSAAEVDLEVRRALECAAATPLWHIERLRLADDEPVILERRWMPVAYCPELTGDDLGGSLYELWTGRFGLDIAGADETIEAVNLNRGDGRRLKVPHGAAALLVRAVGYLTGSRPLWVERTLYRGDAYTFRNRTGPMKTQRPAVGALIDFTGRDE